MKAIIYVEVSTSYQYNSICAFGMKTYSTKFGGHFAFLDFESVIEARLWLRDLADEYYDSYKIAIKMRKLDNNSLTIDAAKASILTLKDREDILDCINSLIKNK